MKPRTLKTYPILAVALTAAGCTAPEPGPAPVPAAVAQRQAAVRVPAAPPPAAPAPEAAAPGDPGVVWAAHYRPLTDDDGYPLVGNMVRKGGGGPRPDGGADGGN